MTPDEKTHELVETLRAMIADLQDHIDGGAAEIAGPRILAAEKRATAAEQRAERQHDQRIEDLQQEFRRQLDALERRRDQLWWLSQYLPEPLRRVAGNIPATWQSTPPATLDPEWLIEVTKRGGPCYDPRFERELAMFLDAVKLVVSTQAAAVTQLQRKMRVGYSTAVTLIEGMQDLGIIDPARRMLVPKDKLDEVLREVEQHMRSGRMSADQVAPVRTGIGEPQVTTKLDGDQ